MSFLFDVSITRLLLASLQVRILRECVSIRDIHETLDRLPQGLQATYMETMERIEDLPNAALAQEILTWVAFAEESLSLEELRYAVAIHPESQEFEEERLVPESTLLSLCCGLITVERYRYGYTSVRLTRTSSLLSIHICTLLMAVRRLYHKQLSEALSV